MFARLAVALIRLYQRWLSPYKGYRCAHRALYGGPSCSEYGIAVVQSGGVFALWPNLRARFAECRAAAATIRVMRSQAANRNESDEPPPAGESEESDEQRKRRGESGEPSWLGACDCAPEACCFGAMAVDMDGGGCDACGFDGCG